jgi:hypothetical protein
VRRGARVRRRLGGREERDDAPLRMRRDVGDGAREARRCAGSAPLDAVPCGDERQRGGGARRGGGCRRQRRRRRKLRQ